MFVPADEQSSVVGERVVRKPNCTHVGGDAVSQSHLAGAQLGDVDVHFNTKSGILGAKEPVLVGNL